MNLEGVALKLLLQEPDKDKALQAYSELRPEYLSEAFKTLYNSITDHYNKQGSIPSTKDLEIYRSRSKKTLASLATLELVDADGADIFFVIDELANQHAQNTALNLIDNLLENISTKDRYELLESVSSIPLRLEESIHKPNNVFSIGTIDIFEEAEVLANTRMPSGISNQWDAEAGGYYRQELVLLGGKRGSGKSIVCANLCVAQAEQGNVSVYFTIEMTAKEVMQRIISIESGVEFSHIKLGTLSIEDKLKICKVISNKFEGGTEFFEAFIQENPAPNFIKFEQELKKSCIEKDTGKIIIVDDRDLTLSSIDTKLASVKSRYGDKFTMAVVDYVNQVIKDGSKDMYDWKDQIAISKRLKNAARKYDVCMVSPYQIDASGKARFAAGILDACDVAQLIVVDGDYLTFETTKARSTSDDGRHKVSINWKTLRIDPREVVIDTSEDEGDEAIPLPKVPNNELELR